MNRFPIGRLHMYPRIGLVPFQLDPARGSAQRACDWLWGGLVENLVQIVGTALGLGAMLILSSGAIAQTSESQPKQANEARSPWKSYPMDRAVGDGGPAPKRDLTGTWAGPGSGAAVPRGTNA